MAVDLDAVERLRQAPEFPAVMECLWLDLTEAKERLAADAMAGGLEYAAAMVLDHWKHPHHLRHMLPIREAAKTGRETSCPA
jgi:hypothetical protein